MYAICKDLIFVMAVITDLNVLKKIKKNTAPQRFNKI